MRCDDASQEKVEARFVRVCHKGASPGVTSSVVNFLKAAPRANCGNAIDDADVSAFSARRMSGVIQSGAWRL
eukprot:6174677-Pleurochrysis_carterae.AAC.8